jgi:hypothetical protein
MREVALVLTARRVALQSVLIVGLVAACATPATTGPLTTNPSAGAVSSSDGPSAGTSGPAATVSGRIDLSSLDVCTLLSEQTVQEVTGSSVGFDSSGGRGKCFWAATRPVPPYVEVEVLSSPGGLAAYNFNPAGCTLAPVTGVGAEAKGATCPGSQLKVYLVA